VADRVRVRVNKLVLKIASWLASATLRRVELWDDNLVIPPGLAAPAPLCWRWATSLWTSSCLTIPTRSGSRRAVAPWRLPTCCRAPRPRCARSCSGWPTLSSELAKASAHPQEARPDGPRASWRPESRNRFQICLCLPALVYQRTISPQHSSRTRGIVAQLTGCCSRAVSVRELWRAACLGEQCRLHYGLAQRQQAACGRAEGEQERARGARGMAGSCYEVDGTILDNTQYVSTTVSALTGRRAPCVVLGLGPRGGPQTASTVGRMRASPSRGGGQTCSRYGFGWRTCSGRAPSGIAALPRPSRALSSRVTAGGRHG
jgi:hypothetical protein